MQKPLEIYADGVRPDPTYIKGIIENCHVSGFTCNPTLVKKIWLGKYSDYCKRIIDNSNGYPVSIQVLTDDISEMEAQARKISSWGENVVIKLPIINTKRQSTYKVAMRLVNSGIKVNITAIFNSVQIENFIKSGFYTDQDTIFSVFAGRLSDIGYRVPDIIGYFRDVIRRKANYKLLWAGSRSIADLSYASQSCDIITLPESVLDKIPDMDKSWVDYNIETLEMFKNDAQSFTL